MLLKSVPLMQYIDRRERQDIASKICTQQYETDDCVISEGDRCKEFFIIILGSAQVLQKEFIAGHTMNVVIANLNAGHFFGELNLMFDEPSEATVKADGPLTCLRLTKAVFQAALSSMTFSQVLKDVMAKRKKSRKERKKSINAASPPSLQTRERRDTDALSRTSSFSTVGSLMAGDNDEGGACSPPPENLDVVTITSTLTVRKTKGGSKQVNKYHIIRELGHGSFADVYLCRSESSNDLYAMKVGGCVALR